MRNRARDGEFTAAVARPGEPNLASKPLGRPADLTTTTPFRQTKIGRSPERSDRSCPSAYRIVDRVAPMCTDESANCDARHSTVTGRTLVM
jgi:hypothetical protein